MTAEDKSTEKPEVEINDGAAENVSDSAETETEAVNSDETQGDVLDAALAEVAELKDQMLREQAETQNVRRRVQRDVENARKFALEKFVGELLPVIDNLERALDAAGEQDSVHEGVELTLKSFIEAMGKFNVVQLSPVGEPFDANFHQAMTMVPNPDMEPNTVMDVMQKGYTLNDRLVRPAMVIVSKAP